MREYLPDKIPGNNFRVGRYLLWMRKTNYKTAILRKHLTILLFLNLVIALSASLTCSKGSRSDRSYYSQPQDLEDGWEISTPDLQGMNVNRISEILKLIIDGQFRDIHSLVIVRNGFLIVDEYFNSYGNQDLHSCYSATKSVSSALMGIAIDKGLIDSVGVRMQDYFQNYQNIDWSNGKDEITLGDMLTMRSGLEWEELEIPYSSPLNSHTQMTASEDWVEFVLQRPMEHVPGQVFEYNSGTSNMFATIIREATGLPIDSFAQDYLFGPLGVTNTFWNRDRLGNPCTGGSRGGLALRPRDMAKFGLLYLNHGEWNHTRIISADWIAESTTRYVNVNFLGSIGYGYQWWIAAFDIDGTTIEVPYAMGYGGQYIFIIENLNMVVVFTGGGGGNEYAYTQVFDIMTEYILPAVEP